jgi:hypothetical protein
MYETSMQNLGASGLEAFALGKGMTLLQTFQEWKLLAHVPMMFGAVTMGYAFMIMIFPLIAALAVFPGRGGSIIMYAHVIVYIHTIIFMLYFILKVGSMMLLGLGVSLAHAQAGGSIFTQGITSQALALETLLLMAVVGVFPIAYFLVFNDKAGLKGLSSKGLDAAGHAVSALATTAGVAAMAARVSGVGGLVKGAVKAGKQARLAELAKGADPGGSVATSAQQANAAQGGARSAGGSGRTPSRGGASDGNSGGIDAGSKMAAAATRGAVVPGRKGTRAVSRLPSGLKSPDSES